LARLARPAQARLGREVYLQVLAYAPEGEEPGLRVDATR
jgi:hypothetical protein